MARYNREFLVPYLRNIYALNLAAKSISDEYERTVGEKEEYESLKEGAGVYFPRPPVANRIDGVTVASLLMGLLIMGVSIVLLFEGFTDLVIGLIIGVVFAMISLYYIVSIQTNNRKAQRIYERDKARAVKKLEHNVEVADSNLSQIDTRVGMLTREAKRLQKACEEVYSANVIPSPYRNMYAVAYLYEWFSTSAADDLDHALSMFVLEEIKARLDKAIENQREIILNQQIQIANQYRLIEQQEQHKNELVEKLNRLERTMQFSAEERDRYLHMIDGELKTISYFSAAEYFRK